MTQSPMSAATWMALLTKAEVALGFSQGFKPLYSPWSLLRTGKVAFMSLNPGRAPDHADLRMVSDERGNSYLAERLVTRSPLSAQFLQLCNLIGSAPAEVITGVAAPFRSGAWGDLAPAQKQASLEIGRRFWAVPLARPDLRLILACSGEATRLAVSITGARLEAETSAAWGNIRLRRYVAPGGKVIVQLPHLSRFRLLGRPASEAAIVAAIGKT
jgi:hypothetical protein